MNTKMKVLALALLGLAGYAGSAVAGCPGSPVPPWSANAPFQGVTAIASPGLDGTPCRLDSSISTGASGFASAQVEDDTPTAEPRYRASFMVNVDALANPTFTTTAGIFAANSTTTGNGINLSIFSTGSGWFLGYVVADSSEASGFFSGSAPLGTGSKHVEFDLQIGASGSFTLWVENNVEGTPTLLPHTVNNGTLVGGIDSAFLGLSTPSIDFVTAYAGTAAQFDRFDSRRTTFIGF